MSPLLDNSGQRWILARDGLSANDSLRTSATGEDFDGGCGVGQNWKANATGIKRIQGGNPWQLHLLTRDNSAASWADFILLASRILTGLLFLATGWGKVSNILGAIAYFTGLGVPSPGLWPYIIAPIEFLIALTLIFGLATRYAAIASFVFVVIATAIAHRYWTYPAVQQAAQYNNFTKNLPIMAAGLLLFIQGGGRYSIDAILAKK